MTQSSPQPLPQGVALARGKYIIDRLLGQGGFGYVYLAHDKQGQIFAIKQCTDLSAAALMQFGYEIAVQRMLNHPAFAKIFDEFAERLPWANQPHDPEYTFVAMEYVPGRKLDELLEERLHQNQGPFAEAQALNWMTQLLGALEYAHSKGVIHRDIKPGNIMLLPDGKTIKVTDFGIAKIGGVGTKTQSGARAISPSYSPPEQYSQAGQTAAYSDVYAAGVTLYHLLTGHVPPEAPARLSGQALTSPRQHNQALSAATEAVILKALKINPAARYQTAAEMLVALQGKAIASTLTASKDCPHCGKAMSATAKFCQHCGRNTVVVADVATGLLSVNALIGSRYRIMKKLGQGGMAAVYQAQDTRLRGRICVIKEMSDALLTDPAERQLAVANFQREAQFLANLAHPNLPRVTDAITETNKYYLVMDFVNGSTLEELLVKRGHPISDEEVRGWLRQVCNVLTYLHNYDPPIIFRDLKPDNIMLDQHGQVKLIDFGIARHFNPRKVKDTAALGTPGFAAPEQYGKSQSDARSDIYALGATIHRLLTGYDPSTTPFKMPPVRTLNPQVSQMLSDVVERCLQLNPNQRWQQAADIQQALGATPISASGSGTPVGTQASTRQVQTATRPTTRLIQTTVQLTTRQIGIVLGGSLLAVVVGILLLASWFRINLPLVWNALPAFLLAGPTVYAFTRRAGPALLAHTGVTLVAWLTLWIRFGNSPADYTSFLLGVILSGLVIEGGLALCYRMTSANNPDAWRRELAWYVGVTLVATLVFYGCWRSDVLISEPLLGLGATLVGALGWFLGDLAKEWIATISSSEEEPVRPASVAPTPFVGLPAKQSHSTIKWKSWKLNLSTSLDKTRDSLLNDTRNQEITQILSEVLDSNSNARGTTIMIRGVEGFGGTAIASFVKNRAQKDKKIVTLVARIDFSYLSIMDTTMLADSVMIPEEILRELERGSGSIRRKLQKSINRIYTQHMATKRQGNVEKESTTETNLNPLPFAIDISSPMVKMGIGKFFDQKRITKEVVTLQPLSSEQLFERLIDDLKELVDYLSKNTVRVILIFDKVHDIALLKPIEPILSRNGVYTIVVANNKDYIRWQTADPNIQGLVKELSKINRYVDCLWELPEQLCDEMLQGVQHLATEEFELFKKHILYRGRGVPVRTINVIGSYYSLNHEYNTFTGRLKRFFHIQNVFPACIHVNEDQWPEIARDAELQNLLTFWEDQMNQGASLFPSTTEVDRELRDSIKLSLYELSDILIEQAGQRRTTNRTTITNIFLERGPSPTDKATMRRLAIETVKFFVQVGKISATRNGYDLRGMLTVSLSRRDSNAEESL